MEAVVADLMSCAYNGDEQQVRMLVQRCDILAVDAQGLNALFYAVMGNEINTIRALVELGGRDLLMATAPGEITCLYLACQDGQVDAIRVLIELGPRELLFVTTDHGSSCLYIASQEGHLEVVLRFYSQQADLIYCVLLDPVSSPACTSPASTTTMTS